MVPPNRGDPAGNSLVLVTTTGTGALLGVCPDSDLSSASLAFLARSATSGLAPASNSCCFAASAAALLSAAGLLGVDSNACLTPV